MCFTPCIAYMQLLKGSPWVKEVVMCNKNLRLKSPLKVNRPLEFIEAPYNIDFALFEEEGGWHLS